MLLLRLMRKLKPTASEKLKLWAFYFDICTFQNDNRTENLSYLKHARKDCSLLCGSFLFSCVLVAFKASAFAAEHGTLCNNQSGAFDVAINLGVTGEL